MEAARSVSSASVSSNTSQLRALCVFGGSPRLPERTQGLDERLVGQLRADEIDRAAEEDLEPGVTRAFREFGRERGLPDPRFPGDEDGRTRPRLRRVERAAELHRAGRRVQRTRRSYASCPWKIRRPAAKDKALRPMRSRAPPTTIAFVPRSGGGER